MATIKDIVNTEKQSELISRLSKGKFTLEDLYEQLENVLKLGPLSKVGPRASFASPTATLTRAAKASSLRSRSAQVMSMIPGFSSNLLPKSQEQLAGQRVKRFMFAMDSMTKEGTR